MKLQQMFDRMQGDAKREIRRIILFVDVKTTIKLTRQLRTHRHKSETYLLSVGRPNFVETRKIKAATKDKDNPTKFPFMEIQSWPVKRAKTVRVAAKATKKAATKKAATKKAVKK